MTELRTLCYHCGIESAENVFQYYNNGKRTQPRYQCSSCQKLFTKGSQGRPQGKVYKERNVDPPELRGLSRECRCCGEADNAPFKYYNNSNLSQPRFKCLSCGQQFQMRLMGTGEEKRLVHTSSYQRPPTSDRPKPGLPPNSAAAGMRVPMQAVADPYMPALEPGMEGFPFLSIEDTKYLDLIEEGLKSEKDAPPPEAILRLQLWASKLPRSCRQRMPLNHNHEPLASTEGQMAMVSQSQTAQFVCMLLQLAM